MKNFFVIKDHLEKLNYVVAIAESGSISGASKQLKLTQSAISHSIATLEDALEVRLLVRKSNGVNLTDAGKILVGYSKKMLAELDDVERKLHNPLDQTAGKLRIASHETLAIHIFPSIVSQFLEDFPNLNLSITSGRVDPLVKGVLDEKYHMVLTVEPLKHHRLTIVPIYTGSIRFYVGTKPLPRFELLERTKLSLEEASSVPLLTDVDAHVRQGLPLPHALAGAGLSLNNLYALNSFEAAMRMSVQGVGIAAVADRNAEELVEKGSLRPLHIKDIDKQFGLYTVCATYLKKRRKHPAIEAMIERLQNSF